MKKNGSNGTRRFLIVDDSKDFCRILRGIVESQPGWSVLAECHDGEEALRLAKAYAPDVMLMDVVMPVKNGIQATKSIQQMALSTHVILFTAFHDEEFRYKGLQAGADYFVWKEELNAANLKRMIATVFQPTRPRGGSN